MYVVLSPKMDDNIAFNDKMVNNVYTTNSFEFLWLKMEIVYSRTLSIISDCSRRER